ncbi:SWC5 [[Candida] subhashii]|uniref:SWR1-complex protein 5 n=1 Tax=[Candida] subhashii TaxID=561895 RepID=A0A8J5QVI3_9ASCO|nr:SWC5 [[Candida] subhashii]KAG7662995.1 SWC5 [[Candida] subhashii]
MAKVKQSRAKQVEGKKEEPIDERDNIGSDEDEDDYDEEEDEDYDPTKKNEDEIGEVDEEDEEEEEDKQEKVPDFSAIESNTTQVRTRAQRLHEEIETSSRYIGNFETDNRGLVKDTARIDVDSIFEDLKNTKSAKEIADEEAKNIQNQSSQEQQQQQEQQKQQSSGPKKIKIETNYTFAGKLITETKLVDEDSREAQAYLSSISSITSSSTSDKPHQRTRVKIFRKDPKSGETLELQIKLKRPSLIDKFLLNHNKRQKLSTLEKSRLDWASFVDKRNIGDELKLHNKAGYLDKQEFLGRVELMRDLQYQQAKQEERKKQAQLQQQQKLV